MPPAARTPPASDPSPPAPTPPRGPGLLPPRPTRAHVSGPTRRARARPSLKPDLTGLLPRPRPGAPRRRGWWEGHRHGRRRLPASRGLAGHRRRPPGLLAVPGPHTVRVLPAGPPHRPAPAPGSARAPRARGASRPGAAPARSRDAQSLSSGRGSHPEGVPLGAPSPGRARALPASRRRGRRRGGAWVRGPRKPTRSRVPSVPPRPTGAPFPSEPTARGARPGGGIVGTRARTAPPKLRLPPLGAASPPGAGATLLPPLLPRRPLRSRGPASAPSAPAAGGAAAAAGAGRRPLA